MNWSEAFNEEHRTGVASFTDMVRKRRDPFAKEAIVFSINELSKMGILMAIPRPVIKDWAIRSISSDDRDAVSVKDSSMHGPIYAGEGYHCLCWIAPVISDLDAPPSPIRIYENGAIKKISKREFVRRCVPNK